MKFSARKAVEAQENNAPSKPKLSCTLAYEKPCCKGTGIHLHTSGAFLAAEKCSCVDNCIVCAGTFLDIDKNGPTANCKTPSPQKVINFFNQSHIPARYLSASLRNFSNYTGNGQAVQKQLDAWLQKYHAQFLPSSSRSLPNVPDLKPGSDPLKSNSTQHGIILHGDIGVGKTYLLAALAKSLCFRGVSVKFVDFFQLISTIKAGYSEQKADTALVNPLLDADVLFIDEMGKGRNTEFELTILDQLVMGRYNQGKIIVASTNYTLEPPRTRNERMQRRFEEGSETQGGFQPDEFGSLEERVGPRIFSRLTETCYRIKLEGKDFRKMTQPDLNDLSNQY